MKSIDETLYRNMQHLLEKYGISERNCTLSCCLNPNFFLNYRKGVTKHFRVCDIIEVARFFEVSIDYLCRYENTSESFFMPKYKLKPRDEKILMNAIRRLDPVGKINLANMLHEELGKTKERVLKERVEKRKQTSETLT
ncbi:MAG: hypothetical protein J6C82_01705 [Clostridia bacterium]|nr:hypothetical protein [Clostridia bacterium]